MKVHYSWRQDTQHKDTQHNGLNGDTKNERHSTLSIAKSSALMLSNSIVMLSVAFFIVILSGFILSGVTLSGVMLRGVMLSGVMLSGVAPHCRL
jgi:uncharacterized protein YjbI with pentapeptide repeats